MDNRTAVIHLLLVRARLGEHVVKDWRVCREKVFVDLEAYVPSN